ncbi:hypothetical protein [Phenylobacterium sp.]|uniref:hypothetical protein n=1 Tax=Phenylobacterium sp. TaxID=1871053 RepID=UPI002FC5EF85
MTSRNLIAIGAAALTLGLSAATLAVAAPAESPSEITYRASPRSSNPHDVFRAVIKVPRAGSEHARMANCDCPMMTGDAATRDMCMTTMGDHHGAATSPKA